MYSLSHNLPSCRVDKDLLIDLEKYLLSKIDIATKDSGAIGEYHLKLKESGGTETIPTIQNYEAQYFPDDMKGISMEAGVPLASPPALNIKLQFHVTSPQSQLEITTYIDPPRETALSIAGEIERRLKPYQTKNYLFDRYSKYFLISTMSFSFALVGIGQTAFIAPTKTLYISVPMAGVTLCWAILMFLKPYTTFRTRLNERRDYYINWLVGGTIAFILFTVIGVYFRQKIFGF